MHCALRVCALIVLLAGHAVPALADEGDTLITDPGLLARFGFPHDARNVYLAKGAVLNQRSSPAEPEEFGTTDFGWTTVLGNQHHPLPFPSLPVYVSLTSDGSIHHSSGSNIFDAPLHMPSGALFQQVTWFGEDDDPGTAGHVEGRVLRVCQTGIPLGSPVVTILGTGESSDGDFNFAVIVPAAEVVRNLTCAYVARTLFVHSPAAANDDLKLRKVRAGWQRQVSPAPATATFPNDVPTAHPYFRFIEALAASGITAGCAPASYCPNSPITRGEMAVFLSVALGLHFPN
jgi:hypothetical protein